MSPEQRQRKPATPADDVYSLGVVLFQMLIGSPTSEPHYVRHELEDVEPAIPEGLISLCTDCFAHPRVRPEDASELLAQLESTLDEHAVVSTSRSDNSFYDFGDNDSEEYNAGDEDSDSSDCFVGTENSDSDPQKNDLIDEYGSLVDKLISETGISNIEVRKYRGTFELNLGDLDTLDTEKAELIATWGTGGNYKYVICSEYLKSLSSETAKHLAKWGAGGQGPREFRFHGVEYLTETTARELSNWGAGEREIRIISFISLKSLDANTAKTLVKWGKGESARRELYLRLSYLDEATAEQLANWGIGSDGERILSIDDLRTIDINAMMRLVNWGKFETAKRELIIGHLETLEPPAAELLAQWAKNEFHELWITEDEIKELAEAPSIIEKTIAEVESADEYELDLDCLTSLNQDGAERLATWNRENEDCLISLNGLKSLNEATSLILAKWGNGKSNYHELHLNGLTELNEATAKQLAKWGNGVCSPRGLHLDGLPFLRVSVAKQLASFGKGNSEWCDLSFNGLTFLNVATAEQLAQWGCAEEGKRTLFLNGLKTLDFLTIRRLSEWGISDTAGQRELCLCGLESLETDSALLLSRWADDERHYLSLSDNAEQELKSAKDRQIRSAARKTKETINNTTLAKPADMLTSKTKQGQDETPLSAGCGILFFIGFVLVLFVSIGFGLEWLFRATHDGDIARVLSALAGLFAGLGLGKLVSTIANSQPFESSQEDGIVGCVALVACGLGAIFGPWVAGWVGVDTVFQSAILFASFAGLASVSIFADKKIPTDKRAGNVSVAFVFSVVIIAITVGWIRYTNQTTSAQPERSPANLLTPTENSSTEASNSTTVSNSDPTPSSQPASFTENTGDSSSTKGESMPYRAFYIFNYYPFWLTGKAWNELEWPWWFIAAFFAACLDLTLTILLFLPSLGHYFFGIPGAIAGVLATIGVMAVGNQET